MAKEFIFKRWLLVGSVLLHVIGNANADTSVCEPGATIPVGGGRNGTVIDEAWSGSTVIFDAVARNGKTYVGYYDADRWLTVAQLDPASGVVCRTRLASRFAGWDSHNSVALAFDKNGRLQVTGNMHDSPLIYGTAASSDSITDITISSMIGRDEENATYPNFIGMPNGDLYFAYRSGVSGNGEWFTNVREGLKWKRTLDAPIFSSKWRGIPTSAYPSAFKVFQDGYVHIAVVWRRSPDVASNYAITYARTRDFVHWEDHNGQAITTPMDPGSSDLIELTGDGQGLINTARVGITSDGRPVIGYTKYGPHGKNVMVLSTPSKDGWLRSIRATAKQKIAFVGGGTIPNLPAFGEMDVSHGKVGWIDIAFPGETRERIFFDVDTLDPADAPKTKVRAVSRHPIDVSPPSGLVDVRRTVRGVRIDRKDGAIFGSIVYFSQGVNRDVPRKCTKAQPSACNPPPSPLIFVR